MAAHAALTAKKARANSLTKMFRILGKRGRITIPYDIRQHVGFCQNDVLSFTESPDGSAVIVRREKICDDCKVEREHQKHVDRVTEIHTVLPYETSLLEIESGKDLCTLVTCTPYGINTHRLLVRGERIPYAEPAEEETIGAENTSAPSTWERQYGKGVLVGILVVTGFGILLWSIQLGRKHHA